MVLSLDHLNFEMPPGDPAEVFAKLYHDDRPPQLPAPLCENLEHASRAGNLAAVKDIYTEIRRIFPGQTTVNTGRSLLWAIENQHVAIVDLLLSENVDVDHWEVFRATRIKNKAVLELLFEKAWDINKPRGWEDPPALACAVEDPDLTAWFLAHGADPNASCPMASTPLSVAVRDAPFSVVEMLLAHGGNVERGQLLHWAVGRRLDDRTTMIEFLLQKGLPINAVEYHDRPDVYLLRQDVFGIGTPLHSAANIGAEDSLRVLISHGARLDIKDSHGCLPVKCAEASGWHRAAQYLREVEKQALSRL